MQNTTSNTALQTATQGLADKLKRGEHVLFLDKGSQVLIAAHDEVLNAIYDAEIGDAPSRRDNLPRQYQQAYVTEKGLNRTRTFNTLLVEGDEETIAKIDALTASIKKAVRAAGSSRVQNVKIGTVYAAEIDGQFFTQWIVLENGTICVLAENQAYISNDPQALINHANMSFAQVRADSVYEVGEKADPARPVWHDIVTDAKGYGSKNFMASMLGRGLLKTTTEDSPEDSEETNEEES